MSLVLLYSWKKVLLNIEFMVNSSFLSILEKSVLLPLVGLRGFMHYFSLASHRVFSFFLVFRSLIMVWFGMYFFGHMSIYFMVLCIIIQYYKGKADTCGVQAFFTLIFLALEDFLLSFQVSDAYKCLLKC